eukprot:TRINITY_DN195_c0_g1_i1.p1 TRINITY_DN195_c0_g1~~TRINITY_DN195_c0_g1_i1.p1  ORF type:complete len:1110 (+),score=492.52 TRINITY_DN195_c0_g1_i1:3702-7031(+)
MNFGDNQPAWKDVMAQSGLDDMTLLSKVSNDQIMENLKERFYNGIIYTNIGDVLISVNPYQWLTIFGPEIIHSYEGKSRIEMPPHIYGLAEGAYRNMVMENENQCILITGESGAGKTEAAKKVMEYISEVSGSENSSQKLDKIKKTILETNPLLEAFGNAKTLRNNNSSRFGKYFEIHFDMKSGEPVGGRIINYLLEKSRVIVQLDGERNFHIFYQFCLAASAEEKQDFGLHGPDAFDYLCKGNCLQVEGMDDVQEFADVRNAMNVIGITADEQYDIFRLLSSILWLGNVDFTENNERAEVADMAVLEFVASLLGVPASFLKTALEIREMETKHGMARGTTYKVPLNYVQACSTRDALAKAIYGRMFDWLVKRVNTAMTWEAPSTLSIGVLDIYGFEVFKKNVFEQFCINYVNEKLQQIFIEFTLRLEQEEYVKEGIQWTPIEFFNNKIVCDLIEAKRPPGIFCVLDDVCRSVHGVAKGADKAFGDRLTSCSSNPHFQSRGKAFLVKHYAGDVTYECDGMAEKNKDTLVNDLINCLSISENQYLLTLFPDKPVAAGARKKKGAMNTAGAKIRHQANELVKTLSKAMPHYCRCLKPNDQKDPSNFDTQRVLHQIKYLGLLDNIKVRRAGFAYRTTYQKFMSRYYLISPRTCYAAQKIWKGDDRTGTSTVLEDSPFGPDQYQLGKTKVFIRTPESLFALEDLRVNYYNNMVSRIKYAFRQWKSHKHECSDRIKAAYKQFKQFKIQCVIIVQRCYRDYKYVAPYADLRMKTEPAFHGKKQRNKLSMASVRKFYGDYLNVKSRRSLLDAMGPSANSEPVIFSSKSQIVYHGGLLKKNKLSPRFLVLTNAALYLVALVKKKNIGTHVLDRRIPINSIQSASLSPLNDNYVILHVPEEFHDAVLEVEFKTELIGWLMAKGSLNQGSVQFSERIEYFKKKKSKNKITFLPDDGKVVFEGQSFYKQNKVKVKPGLPANSQPRSFQKKGFKFIGAGGGRGRGGGGRGRGGRGGRGARGGGGPPRGGRGGGPPRGGRGGGGPPRGGPPPTRARGGPPPTPSAPPEKKCRALYPYEPHEPDELQLSEGDIIVIVEQQGDWWQGKLNGREGLFPANYVELI